MLRIAIVVVAASLAATACSYTESQGLAPRPPVSGLDAAPAPEVEVDDGGGVIGPGDTGQAVARWQVQLADWLTLATTSPRIGVSGLYDATTEAATRQFQTATGQSSDGAVDGADRQAMETALAELEAAIEPLQRGSSGRQAELWQQSLNAFFAIALPDQRPIATDGQFGPGTERTHRQFEERVGLVADGIVTGEDRAAMRSFMLEAQTDDATQTLVAAAEPDDELPGYELYVVPGIDEVCFRVVGDEGEGSACVAPSDDPIEFVTITEEGLARVGAAVVSPEVQIVRLVSLDDTVELAPIDVAGVRVTGTRLPETSLDRVEALDLAGQVIGTAAG